MDFQALRERAFGITFGKRGPAGGSDPDDVQVVGAADEPRAEQAAETAADRLERLKQQAYDLGRCGVSVIELSNAAISVREGILMRAEWERGRADQREAAAAKRRAEAAAKDEAERLEARDFVPDVRVVEYAAGEFLCYDGHEWPRRFIEGIAAEKPVARPVPGVPRMMFIKNHPESVIVRMASGVSHTVTVGPYKVDALLDALVKAWKGEVTS